MSQKIQSKWTKGLNEKERENLKLLLFNNSVLMERVLLIVTEYETEVRNKELRSEEYDNPSWAYKQAFHNGQHHAYAKIKRLFTHLGDHNE